MPKVYLNNREKLILSYFALGLDCCAISRVLGISSKTVSSHKHNALAKIGINKNAQLVAWLRTPEARYSITGRGGGDSLSKHF